MVCSNHESPFESPWHPGAWLIRVPHGFKCRLSSDSCTLVFFTFSEALEQRSSEVGRLKKDLRLKDETIQQREIEISCLRGQVRKEKV